MMMDLKAFLLQNLAKECTENYFALYCSITLFQYLYDERIYLLQYVPSLRAFTDQSQTLILNCSTNKPTSFKGLPFCGGSTQGIEEDRKHCLKQLSSHLQRIMKRKLFFRIKIKNNIIKICLEICLEICLWEQFMSVVNFKCRRSRTLFSLLKFH